MRKSIIITGTAIAAGLIIYFIDALNFHLFSGSEHTFPDALFTGVPLNELIKRLSIFVIIFLFGFIVARYMNQILIRNKTTEQKFEKLSAGIFDNNFLSALSYQLKIPLTAISGFSELLMQEDLSDLSRELYIRQINSNCNFLLVLIRNLSDLIRIESGRLKITQTECHINKMMDEVMNEFKLSMDEVEKNNITVNLKKGFNDPDFKILTDPERLKQVFKNLLENALDNTPKGTIEFGYILKKGKKIEFYVRNTGRKMSVENISLIFQRYNKLSDSDNLPFNGMVLRLAISGVLVKLLGGEIYPEEAGGEDTLIYVSLPFTEVKVVLERREESAKPTVESKDWSGRHLLIVEDVESNFIYLRAVLQPTGIRITWARNGIEALDHIRKGLKFDVVLMDILMPEMDGYEAAREIRKLHPGLPVIAQTAFIFEEKEDNEQAKYFNGYLTKPVWSHQLIEEIGKRMG